MRLTDQQFHRQLLLKQLRANEPVARTDLVALTGLTGGTITALTADLLRKGLIIEEKVPSKTPGRPRVNLRINPHGKHVVGSTITQEGDLVVEIVNLRGETLHRSASRAANTTSLKNLAHQFADAIDQAISSGPVARELIDSVGIGLPAVVDNRSGIVESIASFEPGPCDFAAIVSAAIGLPTSIDNNINLLARAEHWFGDGGNDFTLILIDLGIGAALYRDGHLATGAHGIEPEFGHMKLIPDTGRPCHCGARGCLQAYCSISAIVTQYCELTGEVPPDYLAMTRFFSALVDRLATGEESVRELFSRSAHYFGVALANHINMQDPQRIIVLSALGDRMGAFQAEFLASLEANTFPALRGRTQIHSKNPDHGLYARGAAAMLLERIYSAR